ncbi:MAG: SUMF1/EgtB/PvdO family nonheme iron enzyme, partial [Planctomycetota bacterium]
KTFLREGKDEEAAAAFQKALDIHDHAEAKRGFAEAKSNLLLAEGDKAVEEGRDPEAVQAYEKAKALLEGENLTVPERIDKAVAECQGRIKETVKQDLYTQTEPLIQAGKWEEVKALIKAHLARHGPDAELETLLKEAEERTTPTKAVPVTQNEQGFDQKTNPKDGTLLIRIPEGEFVMGTNGGDKDQQPRHKVFLSSYWIAQTEVTNDQFARFLNEKGSDKDSNGNRMVYSTAVGLKKSGDVWEPQKGYGKHPVVGVTWYGAKAYCLWAGGDLPTEAQWEKAARGEKGAKYPWGSGSPSSSVAVYGASHKSPQPVGSKPKGASPYGVLDLMGNVWEWCRDAYSATTYKRDHDRDPIREGTLSSKRVLRGGAYRFSDRFLDVSNRIAHPPSTNNPYFGFRLVVMGK